MKTMNKILLIALCLTLLAGSSAVGQIQVNEGKKFDHTLGTMVDPRDGREYQTITFIRRHHSGDIMRTWFAENAQYPVEGSYCYNDLPEFCKKYGRLYNYRQAQTACPEGWHVPTIHEWRHLFHFFGGWHHAGEFLIEGEESDMHMLYAGFGEPGHLFRQISVSGNWWDNELKDSNTAGIITLKKGTGEIYHSVIGDRHMLSTRCVQYHN